MIVGKEIENGIKFGTKSARDSVNCEYRLYTFSPKCKFNEPRSIFFSQISTIIDFPRVEYHCFSSFFFVCSTPKCLSLLLLLLLVVVVGGVRATESGIN